MYSDEGKAHLTNAAMTSYWNDWWNQRVENATFKAESVGSQPVEGKAKAEVEFDRRFV